MIYKGFRFVVHFTSSSSSFGFTLYFCDCDYVGIGEHSMSTYTIAASAMAASNEHNFLSGQNTTTNTQETGRRLIFDRNERMKQAKANRFRLQQCVKFRLYSSPIGPRTDLFVGR